MIALYLASARQCFGALKFGDKNTDDMFAPAVDESSDRAAVEHVETPPEQWEPGSGKIVHGWREIHPAVEPRLYRVLVRGFLAVVTKISLPRRAARSRPAARASQRIADGSRFTRGAGEGKVDKILLRRPSGARA